MIRFDLAVIGGGPGGYVAAIRAAQLGLKVCIIEKEKLGGVCLNWGCIPTKALIKNAEVYSLIKHSGNYGIKVQNISVDFKKNVKRSRDIAQRLSKGIEFLMKKNKIKHLNGIGRLKSKNNIEVNNNGKTYIVDTDKIIIATGARPKTFSGLDFDSENVISSKDAMLLENPPKDLIIIGSGAIGVEFAYYFNEFGTKVHILEMMDRILPNEDQEVSEGVTGNVNDIGLEDLGIETEAGAIKTDNLNRTNIDNIYAIGDVCGPPWLAHVASAQGHIAAEHSAGFNVSPIDYSNIPGCTYCQPQVGSLGMTEEEALSSGFKIKVGKFSFQASGKAMAVGDTLGFVKLIFDEKYGELLGAHIVGSEATEMIAELGIAKALQWMHKDIQYINDNYSIKAA